MSEYRTVNRPNIHNKKANSFQPLFYLFHRTILVYPTVYIPKPYLNWYVPTATTRITANCDSDVTLAASSGESYGNSEYYELPKNLPTSSANTPELEGPIQELQKMYEVAEHDINVIG